MLKGVEHLEALKSLEEQNKATKIPQIWLLDSLLPPQLGANSDIPWKRRWFDVRPKRQCQGQ